jgi:hypothetical protein
MSGEQQQRAGALAGQHDRQSALDWIEVLGNPVRRDMLGARVSVTSSSGRTLWRRARSDGSYASSNDPRVLVGLGESGGVVRVQVQWPDGRSEERTGLKTDQYTTLWEGSGR